MKIKITLKDPDGVYEAIKDAAESSLDIVGLSVTEVEKLSRMRATAISSQCMKWIQYDEYVTIEIDTDAGTARVCEVKGN